MLKHKKFGLLLVVLMLIVPLALAACGGDDDKEDKDSGVNLSQSFEASGVSVKYPEGWAARAEEDMGVALTTKEELFTELEGSEATMPSGEAGMLIFAFPLEALGGLETKAGFEMMVAGMGSEGAEPGEITDTKIGDKDAYRVDMAIAEGNDGLLIGFEADGALVIVAGVAAKGELGDFEATFLAIAESTDYSAP